jgi:hypothetical protein
MAQSAASPDRTSVADFLPESRRLRRLRSLFFADIRLAVRPRGRPR